MSLLAVHAAHGVDEAEALRLAGALEHASEHPIASAIATGAQGRVGEMPAVEDFQNLEGLKVQGVVERHAVLVGRASLLAQWSIRLPEELGVAKKQAEAHGRTAVAVAWDGTARAALVVADTVKPTSAEAIRGLRALGLRPVLLTGDNDASARAVAAKFGIGSADGAADGAVIAEVLPADKGGGHPAAAGRGPGGGDGR